MFAKYDKDGDGALSRRELFDIMHGNRNVVDPFGVSQVPEPLLCVHPRLDGTTTSTRLTISGGISKVGGGRFRIQHDMAADPEGRSVQQGGSQGYLRCKQTPYPGVQSKCSMIIHGDSSQGSIFFRIRAERAEDRGWNQGYDFLGDGFLGSSKIR